MNRRSVALAACLTACAVGFASPTSALAAVGPSAPPAPARAAEPGASPAGQAANAVRRLRAAADGAVRVQQDADGKVSFLSSRDGGALLAAPDGDSTPRAVVARQLARYGAAFGLDGTRSRAVVGQSIPSSTGGAIVRAQQVVDGVPVFGGQLVTSLDKDQGLVSVNAATTPATTIAAPRVSESAARRTALGLVARNHHLKAGSLAVESLGRRVYDPALVGSTGDPLGVRPVWQFQVGNGLDVRETVLIGTDRGEVAVHFNDAPGLLDRTVCDNADAHAVSSDVEVPLCTAGAAARTESSAPSAVGDVNTAFDNLGATAAAYSDLDNRDLTSLIGATISGKKSLMSTVRWCFSDYSCPFANAFWNGTQMVFGDGYAGADDVVGHELTHGYVERTSALFFLHQSGALNESLADTIGEIVDHRNGPIGEDNSAWNVGEDLGDPSAVRSMSDPTLHGQPDKMTSPNFYSDDFLTDDGDVHRNDGVGNKTAFLISQGGTFNGQTVTGIDGSDTGLAKTGRLYLETIPRLTSGSDYADLGTVLVSTCQQLADSLTGGFVAADCDSVRAAVAATELSTPAAGGPRKAPITCPNGTAPRIAARDDDGINGFAFSSTSPLWGRITAASPPVYATSGKESLYSVDPDPSGAYADPASGSLVSGSLVVPKTSGGTFLNFHHSYVLDYENNTFYDGGQVLVQKRVGSAWETVSGLPWVNGPDKAVLGSSSGGFLGFSGDSHGYGSSQVDVSTLAGQTVRFVFRMEGDDAYAYYGWWIDDVRLYSCAQPVPSAPTSLSTTPSTTSVAVRWGAPTSPGSGVTHYVVTRTGASPVTLPSSARSVTLKGFTGTGTVAITVAAVGADQTVGPAASRTVYATTSTLASSTTRATKNAFFKLTAKVVRRGTSTAVRGMPLTLQRRLVGSSTWSNVTTGTTASNGTKVWSVRQTRATYYRVLARGVTTWFGSTSATRTVAVR